MGYLGVPPGSVWIWRPVAVSFTEAYRTLVTEFESGIEQRRAKWERPRAGLNMRFERGSLTQDDVQDIWRFYKDKRGALSTFLVPTFGRLTTVESQYPGSGTLLGVADTQDLTTSATSRWNRLWVENAGGTFELFTVASKVNTTTIHVQSGSTQGTVFQVSDPVFPVVKCRFAQDIFSPEYLVALMTTLGIEFTEVRS